MSFEQYSVVRIEDLRRQFGPEELKCSINKRLPKVGDIATVVEVYNEPCLGYELECSGPGGITEWLITFAADDAKLTLVE